MRLAWKQSCSCPQLCRSHPQLHPQTPLSAGHCAAPSVLAAKSSPLSPMTQTDAASVRLDSASQKPIFSRLSSRLRLPSLPSDSIRSPKISAGYPDKGPGLGSARQLGFEVDDHKMPPGFVSSGDLQEDMHLLADFDSEVCTTSFIILLCMCGILQALVCWKIQHHMPPAC